jgi:NAD(P) transhydrogenase subunit beta
LGYPSIIKLAYLVAAVLFIVGLKRMAHPRTAVRGNLLGATGMFLALVVTMLDPTVGGHGLWLAALGIVIGGTIGMVLAQRIEMTAMPQLVALFNGFGGGASILVAGAELLKLSDGPADVLVATAASGVIGSVTFWGSLVAFAKLQELKSFKKPLSYPGQKSLNALLAVIILLVTIGFVAWSGHVGLYVLLVLLASVLGLLLVNPIGGADMPVVIALLNSYSGLAAAATGFVIDNNVLIIAGSLVGASGVILTQLMCKAMNRSLTNVLFGVMDAGSSVMDADEMYATVRSTSADDVAMIL